MIRPQAARRPMCGKVGSEFETNISYNVPMHFRHRQTDRLASWHKREMYILHLALINHSVIQAATVVAAAGKYTRTASVSKHC